MCTPRTHLLGRRCEGSAAASGPASAPRAPEAGLPSASLAAASEAALRRWDELSERLGGGLNSILCRALPEMPAQASWWERWCSGAGMTQGRQSCPPVEQGGAGTANTHCVVEGCHACCAVRARQLGRGHRSDRFFLFSTPSLPQLSLARMLRTHPQVTNADAASMLAPGQVLWTVWARRACDQSASPATLAQCSAGRAQAGSQAQPSRVAAQQYTRVRCIYLCPSRPDRLPLLHERCMEAGMLLHPCY